MNLRKFTILHVEDDPDDVFLIHAAFARLKDPPELRLARDGEEALDYLAGRGPYADRERHPLPSLILLDLQLPRKSGLEVLEWLRGRPELRRIPVAILTSSENACDIQKAYDLGANTYLIKPVDLDALGGMIEDFARYWIERNRGPEIPRLAQPR